MSSARRETGGERAVAVPFGMSFDVAFMDWTFRSRESEPGLMERLDRTQVA